MKKDKKESDALALVESLANEMLSLMGTKAKAVVSYDKKNDAIKVAIESGEEAGLLIGRHGETLNSIQTILGMMVKTKLGEWKRIVVDVGDWREKQEDYIKILAQEAAARVKESGQEEPLYNLTANQRRIIHLALSEDPDVETESQGEGSERYLVVKPKKK